MKDFLKNNGVLILIAAVLLSLITAVVSYTFGGVADPITNVFGVIATPFRNAFHAMVSWSEGVYSDTFERESMEAELSALKKENAQLRRQALDVETTKQENERLKDLLGLAEKRPELTYQDATVTRRSAHGSYNWAATLTVNKGTASEVQVGDCVVDQYGYLVGVVSVTGLNWSTVRTVVDVDLEMGGLIARTDEAAILEGDFALMGQGKLKLTYLPEDAEILPGDTILTSGLKSGDEATYPAGLVVGTVDQLLRDESGMSDYAVLTPSSELNGLEQVFIITDFSQN